MEIEMHCDDCKTWEEEIYWKCFSCRHICLVLSSTGAGQEDYRRKLDLPHKFSENMKSKLPEKVKLQGPSGSTFGVKITTNSGILSFVDGWEEFVSSYSLKEGDILVMSFDGTPRIRVMIFNGGSHCEKESAYFFRKCGHHDKSKKRKRELMKSIGSGSNEVDPKDDHDEDGFNNNFEEVEGTDCADDDVDLVDGDHDDDCEVPVDDGCADGDIELDGAGAENHGCKSHCDSGGQKAGKDSSNNKPSNNNDSSSEAQTLVTNHQKKSGTSPPQAKSSAILACPAPEADATSLRDRPHKKCVTISSQDKKANSAPSMKVGLDQKRKRGRPRKMMVSSAPIMKLSSPIKKLTSASEKNNLVSPHRRSATAAEKKLALENARVQKDTMSFVISMKPSHVYRRFFLTIPMTWFVKHLQHRKQQVSLMLGDNKWTATLCYGAKSNTATVYGGWRQFVVDNMVDEGDACLFKLISTEEPAVFQVQIFRAVPLASEAPLNSGAAEAITIQDSDSTGN